MANNRQQRLRVCVIFGPTISELYQGPPFTWLLSSKEHDKSHSLCRLFSTWNTVNIDRGDPWTLAPPCTGQKRLLDRRYSTHFAYRLVAHTLLKPCGIACIGGDNDPSTVSSIPREKTCQPWISAGLVDAARCSVYLGIVPATPIDFTSSLALSGPSRD